MSPHELPRRGAPRLPRSVTALGWGAFKIGRNEGIKYPSGYALPTQRDAVALVGEVIAAGIRVIDTAPAYGLSEARIGVALAAMDQSLRRELFISTKAGEFFDAGRSTFDFSGAAIDRSVRASLERLQSQAVDIVWVHSDGSDSAILNDGAAVEALSRLKERGIIGAIGFSPKSVAGGMQALSTEQVDAVMVEFHPGAPEMAGVIAAAGSSGRGVFIKKPLGSGRLDPAQSLPWILENRCVTCAVVGGLSIERIRANVALVASARNHGQAKR